MSTITIEMPESMPIVAVMKLAAENKCRIKWVAKDKLIFIPITDTQPREHDRPHDVYVRGANLLASRLNRKLIF